jgi:nucleoside transporter
MAAAASLVLGVFSFTLPRTPPQQPTGRSTVSEMLGLEALALLRNRNFLVFFAASILICIPLAFYYQHANQFLTEIRVENATGKQTLGQASEVFFMLLVPFFLKRFGMKVTLLVGMLAWALRYVLFAYGNEGELVFMLLVGIALHGVCYDFFFVSGQVFTDSKAGPRYKSAAQGLITLATYGVGMLIGFWIAGRLTDAFAVAGGHDWRSIWIYPAAFAAVVAVLFAVLFKNEVVDYGRGDSSSKPQ